MKKITLTLFLLTCFCTNVQSQTFSTGTVQLNSNGLNFTAKLDVTSTLVTLTMVGPSDRWMCVGFSNSAVVNMASGTDVVAFNGTLSDRTLGGIGAYDLDNIQDWTLTSNNVESGVRTVIGTRALNTGEVDDYVFSASATAINFVWARASSATNNYAPHGGLANGGNRPANLTLGNNSFETVSFKMFPNPAKGFTNIELPNFINSADIKVYDNMGRLILKKNIIDLNNKIYTNDLLTGNYMVVVRTDYGVSVKQLIIE